VSARGIEHSDNQLGPGKRLLKLNTTGTGWELLIRLQNGLGLRMIKP
jgi:hypothetical protein